MKYWSSLSVMLVSFVMSSICPIDRSQGCNPSCWSHVVWSFWNDCILICFPVGVRRFEIMIDSVRRSCFEWKPVHANWNRLIASWQEWFDEVFCLLWLLKLIEKVLVHLGLLMLNLIFCLNLLLAIKVSIFVFVPLSSLWICADRGPSC